MPVVISLPTAFKAELDSHVLVLLTRQVGLKMLSVMRNAMSGTLTGNAFELAWKA